MPNFPKFRAVDVGYLNYDAETSPFTKGKTLTQSPSGANGIIELITDNGTDGTLRLVGLSTTAFVDDQTITDDNGTPGSATADGVVTYEEYTWESWDNQNRPTIESGTTKVIADRIVQDARGKVIALEPDDERIYWDVEFPFISTSEVIEFAKWAKRRAFWFYPNSDLSTRYLVEWATFPFQPETLQGGSYTVAFTLLQINKQA